MAFNTEVLIVGAGPTGLTMACQLLRFGISFRIIDKAAERSQESRAFAIQAKSMEIFQNLGIASEFLEKAESNPLIHIYIHGKEKAKFEFGHIPIADTPFPSVYFLPQSETERILIARLAAHNIKIERQVSLESFSQTDNAVKVNIKNDVSNATEEITCRYIIGCDGAHSTVRHILDVPFEGAPYLQEFLLADAAVEWSFPPSYKFLAFFDKKGLFLHIPMGKNLSRIMGAEFATPEKEERPLTGEELEKFASEITHSPIKLSNVVWMSRFRLHHRAAKQYQINNAFLAGDAAHIHSPVGGQGMNTGIQDVTNLAWKIALVIKKNSPASLLETYQRERQRVGEILLKTTDRLFTLITTKKFLTSFLRPLLMPLLVPIIGHLPQLQKRILLFISQLTIHYHENQFVQEKTSGADKKFLLGPKAGCRAPDAPLKQQTLFELFKEKPFNILIFCAYEQQAGAIDGTKIKNLLGSNGEWFGIYKFIKSPETKILFDRYGISDSGIYFIRPDGYIGFRSYGDKLDALLQYLKLLI